MAANFDGCSAEREFRKLVNSTFEELSAERDHTPQWV